MPPKKSRRRTSGGLLQDAIDESTARAVKNIQAREEAANTAAKDLLTEHDKAAAVFVPTTGKQMQLREEAAQCDASTVKSVSRGKCRTKYGLEFALFFPMLQPIISAALDASNAARADRKGQTAAADRVRKYKEVELLQLVYTLMRIDQNRRDSEDALKTRKRLAAAGDKALLSEKVFADIKTDLRLDLHRSEILLSSVLLMWVTFGGQMCGDETLHKDTPGSRGSVHHPNKPGGAGTMARTCALPLKLTNLAVFCAYRAQKEQSDAGNMSFKNDLAAYFDGVDAAANVTKVGTVDAFYCSLAFCVSQALRKRGERILMSTSGNVTRIPGYKALIFGMVPGEVRTFACGPLTLTVYMTRKGKIIKNLATTYCYVGEPALCELYGRKPPQFMFITDGVIVKGKEGDNVLCNVDIKSLADTPIVTEPYDDIVAARYKRWDDDDAAAAAAAAAEAAKPVLTDEEAERMAALHDLLQQNVSETVIESVWRATKVPGVNADDFEAMIGLAKAEYRRKRLAAAKEIKSEREAARAKNDAAAQAVAAANNAAAAAPAAGGGSSKRQQAKRKLESIGDALSAVDDEKLKEARDAADAELSDKKSEVRKANLSRDVLAAELSAYYLKIDGMSEKKSLLAECQHMGVKVTYKREVTRKKLLTRKRDQLLNVGGFDEVLRWVRQGRDRVLVDSKNDVPVLKAHVQQFNYVDRLDTRIAQLESISNGMKDDVKSLLWYSIVLLVQTFSLCVEEKAYLEQCDGNRDAAAKRRRTDNPQLPRTLPGETVIATRGRLLDGMQQYITDTPQ